ncbi:MAG: hypothetical protein ACK47B_10945 [Armatimonadota bacterium]
MLTLQQAVSRLRMLVSAETDPELTDAELRAIVAMQERATVWTAETAYQVGDRVIPTGPNGRVYVCRTAGTSDAIEPDFGEAGDHFLGRLVDDGTELEWQDGGPMFAERFDLRAACHEAWMLKAAKCSDRSYLASGGQMFSRQQVHEHCLKMAARYTPLMIA